jgi:hypothetical protein
MCRALADPRKMQHYLRVKGAFLARPTSNLSNLRAYTRRKQQDTYFVVFSS